MQKDFLFHKAKRAFHDLSKEETQFFSNTDNYTDETYTFLLHPSEHKPPVPQSNLQKLCSNQRNSRNRKLFKSAKLRTEKSRGEFVFKTCGLVNKTRNSFDILNQTGLKRQVLTIIQSYFGRNYSEINPCAWLLACDCRTCRNRGTMS